MAKYVKIITDCAFCGCDTTRIVKVDDDVTEEYLQEISDEFLEGDIQPSASYEILEDGEVDDEIENGYDLVDMTTEEE